MLLSHNEMLQLVLTRSSQELLRKKFPGKLKGLEHCHHVTLYHPASCAHVWPYDSLPEVTDANIYVIGLVQTSYVEAVTCMVQFDKWMLTHQGGGRRLLHITLRCAEGVSPVASNDAIMTNEVEQLEETYCLNGITKKVVVG